MCYTLVQCNFTFCSPFSLSLFGVLTSDSREINYPQLASGIYLYLHRNIKISSFCVTFRSRDELPFYFSTLNYDVLWRKHVRSFLIKFYSAIELNLDRVVTTFNHFYRFVYGVLATKMRKKNFGMGSILESIGTKVSILLVGRG